MQLRKGRFSSDCCINLVLKPFCLPEQKQVGHATTKISTLGFLGWKNHEQIKIRCWNESWICTWTETFANNQWIQSREQFRFLWRFFVGFFCVVYLISQNFFFFHSWKTWLYLPKLLNNLVRPEKIFTAKFIFSSNLLGFRFLYSL